MVATRTRRGSSLVGQELLASAGTVLVALLWGAALLLFGRRLSGAIDASAHLPMLLAVGVGLGGATLFRLGWQGSQFAAGWLAIPPLLLLGVALTPSEPGAGLAYWLLLLAGDQGSRWLTVERRGRIARRSRGVETDRGPLAPFPKQPGPVETPHERLEQQMVRRCSADGAEHVTGRLRVPLEAGQRSALAHVAFCPPLADRPEVSVEATGGPAVRLKVAQALPYGARFELKLAQPAECATEVWLDYAAVSKG